jgi:hypothetical protein
MFVACQPKLSGDSRAKGGGPPETRTPDPLIKSPTPATRHPTPNYCSEGKQKLPMVAFVAVRTDCTDTKRTQLETVPAPLGALAFRYPFKYGAPRSHEFGG